MSANGGDGFRTYQSEILDSGVLDSLYILKGGPGTGKSTFMKKLLDRALDSGADVRIFKCSSDPDSIDALYITSAAGRFAITDGTAPHERNAEIPGAVDHIIDLGLMDGRVDDRSVCRLAVLAESCEMLVAGFVVIGYKRCRLASFHFRKKFCQNPGLPGW